MFFIITIITINCFLHLQFLLCSIVLLCDFIFHQRGGIILLCQRHLICVCNFFISLFCISGKISKYNFYRWIFRLFMYDFFLSCCSNGAYVQSLQFDPYSASFIYLVLLFDTFGVNETLSYLIFRWVRKEYTQFKIKKINYCYLSFSLHYL